MPEDPRRREQAHKHALNLEYQPSRSRPFSFNEKATSDGPRRREQAPKLFPQPKRPDCQVKHQDFPAQNQPLKTEIELEGFTFVHL